MLINPLGALRTFLAQRSLRNAAKQSRREIEGPTIEDPYADEVAFVRDGKEITYRQSNAEFAEFHAARRESEAAKDQPIPAAFSPADR